jgi:hypothetical protein
MDKNERRNLILNLLTTNELSTKEIADRIGIPTNLVSPIISEFKRQGKIYSILPQKYTCGIRKENSKNEIVIEKYEWIELIDYGIKIWYEKLNTFSGIDAEGYYYQSMDSDLNVYQNGTIIDSLSLPWDKDDIGIAKEYSTECSSHKLFVIYHVISDKFIKIKVTFQKKKEKKLTVKEQEEKEKSRKKISDWMNEYFK